MNLDETTSVTLEPNEEYRIEVAEQQKLKIKINRGIAEIKGKELLLDNWYSFTDTKTSIYTFTGCVLEIQGNCELQFRSDLSPFPSTFELFQKIYNKDDSNLNVKSKNVLILGEGKSTAALTLCNFFVRLHEKVNFTEIDPSKGNIFPGALSTMPVNALSDGCFEINNPFCLFYGSKDVSNTELYEMQLKTLSERCPKDTLNVILGCALEPALMEKIIQYFSVGIVAVVGDERLFHTLNFHENLGIEKFFIRNTGFTPENKISKSVKKYFYGTNEFTPSRIVLNKNNISVLKLGEDFAAPDSALPLGTTRKLGLMGIEEVDIQEGSILGISSATEKENVINSPVMGFVVCVDEKKGKVLCCQPKLPSKTCYLIQGNLKYVDY